MLPFCVAFRLRHFCCPLRYGFTWPPGQSTPLESCSCLSRFPCTCTLPHPPNGQRKPYPVCDFIFGTKSATDSDCDSDLDSSSDSQSDLAAAFVWFLVHFMISACFLYCAFPTHTHSHTHNGLIYKRAQLLHLQLFFCCLCLRLCASAELVLVPGSCVTHNKIIVK